MYIMELFSSSQAGLLSPWSSPAENYPDSGKTLFDLWHESRCKAAQSEDSTTINCFKEVTLNYIRESIGTKRFNCTFTLSLDLNKRALSSLRNDHIAQWRHIKQQMRAHMGTYKYRYYMIPEYTKRGVVHSHGVISFNCDTYDDYCYERARWVRKMSLKVGRSIQWTRVNDLYKPYMPTESNRKIRVKQTFENWIVNYCHKSNVRKKLGHSNMYK